MQTKGETNVTSLRNSRQSASEAREVAGLLLAQGAVSINAAHPFVYASGIISPIYCDLRLLMASLQRRQRIVELLAESIQETCAKGLLDVVAGVATAGIPWAAWVADRLSKPMAYVRDAPKGHGKGQQVEGGVTPGQAAIVLEDLTSTGGSALTAAEALREVGARVDHCFSIFTYELPQTGEAFRAAGVKLVSLCGISTLLEVAMASGQIDGEGQRAVREWLQKGPTAAQRVEPAQA